MPKLCNFTRMYIGSTEYTFVKNGSMIFLDLSFNQLSSEIPKELGNMYYLMILNLGHNLLSGLIPLKLAGAKKLAVLDLSRNQLEGPIPDALSALSLSEINLSNNLLNGSIPELGSLATFPESQYENNLGLCGFPLKKRCSETESTLSTTEGYEGRGDDEIFLFLAVGSGFLMGLWIVFVLLLFNKNWRVRCFLFSDRLYDWVYVQVNLSLAFLTWKKDNARSKADGGSSFHISHT